MRTTRAPHPPSITLWGSLALAVALSAGGASGQVPRSLDGLRVSERVSEAARGALPGALGARLPWPSGQRVWVTQDCSDACWGDHVGSNAYAWDFAAGGAFDVLAPREGTIVHAKLSSSDGGGDARHVDEANYLVLDHGDGTYSVLLHLERGSLDPAARCGGFVRRGQRLARTGATGWATGNHLHFQVNSIPRHMPTACECGPEGLDCRADEARWELFWSRDASTATRPVAFEEWPEASACGERHHDHTQVSRNEDLGERVTTLGADAPAASRVGAWREEVGGARGRYFSAPAGTGARVRFSPGASVEPGVYQVWNALPAGALPRTPHGWVEVVSRGERARHAQDLSQPGGGFHPVGPRFKLTGRPGEGVTLGDGGAAGEVLTADAITLVRVDDVGSARAGEPCGSSAACEGDLVCLGGRCEPGCETSGCGADEACDATGLCGSLAEAQVDPPTRPLPPVAPSVFQRARRETARAAKADGGVRGRGGGPVVAPPGGASLASRAGLGALALFALVGVVSGLPGLRARSRRR